MLDINNFLIKYINKKVLFKSDIKEIIRYVENNNFYKKDLSYYLIITKSIHKDRNWRLSVIPSIYGKNKNNNFDLDINSFNEFQLKNNLPIIDSKTLNNVNVFPQLIGWNCVTFIEENIGLKWADKLLNNNLDKIINKYSVNEMIIKIIENYISEEKRWENLNKDFNLYRTKEDFLNKLKLSIDKIENIIKNFNNIKDLIDLILNN